MSILSFEKEVITSHSEICKCGLMITRSLDKANGICAKCNPFTLKSKKVYRFGRVTRDNETNLVGSPEFAR